MWTEEKIKYALDKKKEQLKLTKSDLETARVWLKGAKELEAMPLVLEQARQANECYERVRELEVQIKVLEVILDNG